ncbi:MAG: phosphoribosylglycinamide formyltransferase [Bacillota bacterium]|nr:phosphoribosylglycinamide formyltransferase [Bacillota bacterium]
MCRDLKKFAVLVSGGGSNLQALIDACAQGQIKGNLSLVVCNRKAAFGLERAKIHGIEAIYLRGDDKSVEDYDQELLNILKERDIDFVVLAGFLKILGPDFISAYENKIINIHPSLIPAFCGQGYYGLKVHQAALDYGVKLSGATTHFVSPVADAGPIIYQVAVPVLDGDQAEDLQKRIIKEEHKLLVKTVKDYCDDKLQIQGRIVKVR